MALEQVFTDEFGAEDLATTRRVLRRVRDMLALDAADGPVPLALLPGRDA